MFHVNLLLRMLGVDFRYDGCDSSLHIVRCIAISFLCYNDRYRGEETTTYIDVNRILMEYLRHDYRKHEIVRLFGNDIF